MSKIERFMKTAHPSVISKHLQKMRNPAFVRQVLEGDRDPEVRTIAGQAFVRIGPSAVPHAAQALGHKDTYVRMIAAHALGDIGDPSALPALEKALAKEKGFMAGRKMERAISLLRKLKR
ncbi:MAG TPA: HEAT repeat domain-containing protein [Candidatus Norongarragalinales archaeon]|jgi:HEAT repeat protein|nr:HEAT repeat domain-containing protein [Candidatus Norongarragalinales archaeon]